VETVPNPDDPEGQAVVDDVVAVLRKFAGDDLSQQDAIRALGMWQRNSSLSAAERAAILGRFAPDPGQAKIVKMLSTFQRAEEGAR